MPISFFSERASTCKYCQKEIVWRDHKPYEAVLRNEVYIAGELHYNSCPAMIKKREQKSCPICRLKNETITNININRPMCRIHEGDGTEYRKLRIMKLRAKRTVKKAEEAEAAHGFGLLAWGV